MEKENLKANELTDEELASLSGGHVLRYKGKFYICRIIGGYDANTKILPLKVVETEEEALKYNYALTGGQMWGYAEDYESITGKKFTEFLEGVDLD